MGKHSHIVCLGLRRRKGERERKRRPLSPSSQLSPYPSVSLSLNYPRLSGQAPAEHKRLSFLLSYRETGNVKRRRGRGKRRVAVDAASRLLRRRFCVCPGHPNNPSGHAARLGPRRSSCSRGSSLAAGLCVRVVCVRVLLPLHVHTGVTTSRERKRGGGESRQI